MLRLRRLSGYTGSEEQEVTRGIGFLLAYSPWKQEDQILWLFGYLGRYGRTSPSEVMDWPATRAWALLHEVGEIIKRENAKPKDVFSEIASDEWR